jgi:hypothetical protein
LELVDSESLPEGDSVPDFDSIIDSDTLPQRSSDANLIVGDGVFSITKAADVSLTISAPLRSYVGAMDSLLVASVPLSDGRLIAYSDDVDIIYNDDTRISPVMLANTCRYSFMEGDFDGVIVPLNVQDLHNNLPPSCIAPDPEGDALFMGIVSGNHVQTPGQRTAYRVIRRSKQLTFQDRNIIYVDASRCDVNVTLPESDNPNTDGRIFTIKQINYSADCSYRVKITTEGSATIDGMKYYSLNPIKKTCRCGRDHNTWKQAPSAVRLQYALGNYQII